jgi:hypothetical protein
MSIATVAHDGTTPRKTNRSSNNNNNNNNSATMIMPSATTTTTIRSRNFESLANILPYINNHHETPRNSNTTTGTSVQQRTIIPRPIIMIETNNDDAPSAEVVGKFIV